MSEFKKHKQEIKPYLNTLVLLDFKVVKLIEAIDHPTDIYNKYDGGEGIMLLASRLIGFIPLKGILPESQYNELVRIWNLNNKNPAI